MDLSSHFICIYDIFSLFIFYLACTYFHFFCVLPGPGPGTRQDRYGGNKFKGTPNPLTSYARIEHALVGQSLLEIIGPRLQGEVSFSL